tara:strand:+ start:49 stop:192 length:144 start_codon:yes stop_codon:yes gene_type:complete
MHEKFTANKTESDQFTLRNENSDYQNLINRLKEMSLTIALLEKTKCS